MTHAAWLKRGAREGPARQRGRPYEAAAGRRGSNLFVASILSERNEIGICRETKTFVLPFHFTEPFTRGSASQWTFSLYITYHPTCLHQTVKIHAVQIKSMMHSIDERKSTCLLFLKYEWNNSVRLNCIRTVNEGAVSQNQLDHLFGMLPMSFTSTRCSKPRSHGPQNNMKWP